MNYFNTLTELESIKTTHLSNKGSVQVQDFIEFVRPLIPDIKKGEAAKAKIAKYYLEHKSEYTEGCKNALEPLVNQLGVSPGYISQIKKADEYKNSLHDTSLRTWVDEHPVSIQYYLTRVDHQDLISKYKTGEHFSKKEAQSSIQPKVKTEPTDPTTEYTRTQFQIQMETADRLANDESKPYLYDTKSAQTYMNSTTPSVIAACMQKVSEIKVCDEKRYKQLAHLQKVISEAMRKPSFYTKP